MVEKDYKILNKISLLVSFKTVLRFIFMKTGTEKTEKLPKDIQ